MVTPQRDVRNFDKKVSDVCQGANILSNYEETIKIVPQPKILSYIHECNHAKYSISSI